MFWTTAIMRYGEVEVVVATYHRSVFSRWSGVCDRARHNQKSYKCNPRKLKKLKKLGKWNALPLSVHEHWLRLRRLLLIPESRSLYFCSRIHLSSRTTTIVSPFLHTLPPTDSPTIVDFCQGANISHLSPSFKLYHEVPLSYTFLSTSAFTIINVRSH